MQELVIYFIISALLLIFFKFHCNAGSDKANILFVLSLLVCASVRICAHINLVKIRRVTVLEGGNPIC